MAQEPLRDPIEYVRRAEECEALAEQATDAGIKDALSLLADHWRSLASQAEQLKRYQ